ncbi:MAG: serine hydrolase [Armatimonadota bacterium]|nr:serine hydrolase [Armatimonadota bacterium]MDR7468510.1 serine hydrolase [Armatimonadota bacterium]MDR7495044.1 serine hydrolase [Armatimonadota bacterium]MDR7505843.1 serine hydrolase [Armatimonadota bacterium]MDR7546223.1 serine hydrolase [Armatimonadota bacterium]
MTARFDILEQFIQEKMAETHLPGLSIALVERGETVYARGFGFRDGERGLPATPRTLYGIGSVTKSFTCLAIMQLQERGKLRVDDPVDRYLPLRVKPFGRPITLHHFMTHSSGIPALAYAEAVIRHAAGASDTYLPIASDEDMLTFVNGAEDWVHSPPGARWFYLNEGYILLGAVIEKVSGQSYADYLQEHILDPLGMKHTHLRKERVEAEPDVAVPYVITKDKTQVPSRYLYGRLTSDGGLISSVEDMIRYVGMFLQGGRTAEGRLASAASLAAMTTGYVDLPPEVYPADARRPIGKYGYGISIYPGFFGHTLIGHGGSVLVSTAHLAFVPEREVGVMVLANGSGYPMAHIAGFALAVLLGEDPWTLPGIREERALERLTGRYETYRGTYGGTVKRAGDFLILEIKNRLLEQSVPLVPVSLEPERARFFTLALGRRLMVEFEIRDGGVDLIYERYRMRRTGSI